MSKSTPPDERNGSEIAVIGMAGRFPGAGTVEEFWQNLCDGVESIVPFSDEELEAAGVDATLLNDPRYVKAGGVLDGIEEFDAAFFGLNPREAEIMDPQHRLFLECAWQALERAGYDSEQYAGSIGVYAGSGMNTYLLFNLYPNRDLLRAASDLQLMLANDKDFIATRISYKLNLDGPSVVVQSACSTSLVAVHLACQSLLAGECDMALAGGVTVRVPQKAGYLYEEGGMVPPDGHCRAFDARGRGTAFNSGLGIVVLKRLDDALADGDHIHAVVKGSAINNDGAQKIGYTAPRVEGQAKVIRMALKIAGILPQTIHYVEAHGTGTALGDPVEVAALTQAFRCETDRRGYCALGSVKTNIGHLDAAAGVTGLIKTVLALEHDQIPPSLHFEQPNPQIDFEDSPFYVSTRLKAWPRDASPRRAAVSSFGIGGTNAHLILEQAPEQPRSGESRPWQVLLLSAKSEAALDTATGQLASYLQGHPEVPLADMAFTLQVGRRAFEHRRMILCEDQADALFALEQRETTRVFSSVCPSRGRPVTFMFSGLGDQYVNMARELYEREPHFRAQVDHCAELLKPHLGVDVRTVLYPDEGGAATRAPERSGAAALGGVDLLKMLRWEEPEASAHAQALNRTALLHPILSVVEYALARLWMEWGVRPRALVGYSIGEYVAACLAGVLSLEEMLYVVAKRAQMIDGLPEGAMVAVPLSEQEVQAYLGKGVWLSAVNGPAVCVLGGTPEAVAKVKEQLAGQGLAYWEVQAAHAMHSGLMEPLAGGLRSLMASVKLKAPQIPYVSNVTGKWITAEQATDPEYWVRHLCGKVRFAEAVERLGEQGESVYLEIGPGQTLCNLMRHAGGRQVGEGVVLPSLRHAYWEEPDMAVLARTVGQLWLAGVELDWAKFYAQERRRRVGLPTYPFERQRYWIDPPGSTGRSRITREQPSGEGQVALGQGEPGSEPLGTPPRSDIPSEGKAASSQPKYPRPKLRSAYVPPRSETEKILADLWQQVLNIQVVGIHDNFIELGGDSVLGIQIVARANQAKLRLTPRQLFQHQTIAELAEVVGATTSVHAEQGIVTGPVPLTPMQHWFFEQSLWESEHLAQAVVLEAPPDLQPQRLEQVVRQLLEHHDALRLRFEPAEAGWQQTNAAPDDAVPFTVVDLSDLPADDLAAAMQRLAVELRRSIHLLQGPLIRVACFRCGVGAPWRLLLLIHHLAVDAISQRILLEDLSTAYQQQSSGQAVQLPPKTTCFKEWAGRLAEHGRSAAVANQLSYWLAEPRSRVSPLPLDGAARAEAHPPAEAAHISTCLGLEETRALLREVPQAYNAQVADVLLTALVQAFAQWTGQLSLWLDLTSHGRGELFEDVDVSRTVGWFTTIFPVLLELAPAIGPGEALKAIKEQLRCIPSLGLGYGLLRYLSGEAARERFQSQPQPEVCFNYLGQFDQAAGGPSPFRLIRDAGAPIRSPWGGLRHRMEINAMIVEGQLQLSWMYDQGVHRRATVEHLAGGFMDALRALIAHCQSPQAGGYTPSDFPKARLTQQDVDNILLELAGTE